MNKLTSFALLFILTSCSSTIDKLSRVGKGPELKRMDPPVMWGDNFNEVPSHKPNSLWQSGARSFFKDTKARGIGDILKVKINIKDKATLNNSSKTKRVGNEKITAPQILGGLEKSAAAAVGVNLVNPFTSITEAGNTEGTGNIDRNEDIVTEIAAMVVQILPNGNLVIKGNQQIKINYEVREVTIAGIVRQDDISVDNTVNSDQIAEARISYGGKGTLSDIQQPRYGNQILDAILPF